jgi:hypothetical protein
MRQPEVAISVDELELGLTVTENHDQYALPGVPRSEYHERCVKPKFECRPWLDILSEFLDPKNTCFAVPPNHRLLFFDVEVIHISASGVNTPIKCKNATEFNDAISSVDNERIGTVVIAEDLSGAMIDALGMQYELEPEFFACHLQGTQMFRMGHWESPTARDPVRAPNILPDGRRKAPYYTVEFRRPYHIPGGLTELMQLRSSKTNTPRGAQTLGGDIPNLFVFEKVSVYKRKGANFGMFYC